MPSARCDDCGCHHTTQMDDATKPWWFNRLPVSVGDTPHHPVKCTNINCGCHTQDGTRELLGLEPPAGDAATGE